MVGKKQKRASRHAAETGGAESTAAPKPKGLFAYWPRLLYLIPAGLILWVPSYNRIEPALAGIPFFYWYQLALLLLGAAVVLIVYLLDTRVTGATPRAGGGVDPGATGDVL